MASKQNQRVLEAVLLGGLLLAASVAARRATDKTWKLVSDEPPPDPDDPHTELREAMLWSLGSGLLVGMTRLFVRREFARIRHQGLRGEARTIKAQARKARARAPLSG